MLQGQDVIVAVALASGPREWSYRALGERLGLAHASVQRAVDRLADARLYTVDRKRTDRRRLEEFLVHGVKYAFPAHLGAETRGIPTAWAAGSLAKLITRDERPPVWPSPAGMTRGRTVDPLHPSATALIGREDALVAVLMAVDAVRLDEPRIRKHAARAVRYELDRLVG